MDNAAKYKTESLHKRTVKNNRLFRIGNRQREGGHYIPFSISRFITFAGKSNWAVQGVLKGFYVNCEFGLL